jgi:putative adhesin
MRLTAATGVMVVTTALAGCEVNLSNEGFSARETKTFKVTGQPQLVLDTFDGAIELHSWDRPEVEVEIEKRAMEQTLLDEIKIETDQKGDVITLKVTGPTRTQFRGVTVGVHISPTARLRVAVPRNSNIQATSGDGSIRAEALEGKLVLKTVDGSVVGTRLGGDVQIRTGDGSIRLDNVTGNLDLETTDGSIGLDDAKPTVLKARTGDGSIRATIEPDTAMADNWELTTSDGTVVLTLPGLFNAELDAETSDGSVRTSHPLLDDDRAVRRDGEGSDERRERRRTLRSKMGEGGKLLRIRTGDGTIRIER